MALQMCLLGVSHLETMELAEIAQSLPMITVQCSLHYQIRLVTNLLLRVEPKADNAIQLRVSKFSNRDRRVIHKITIKYKVNNRVRGTYLGQHVPLLKTFKNFDVALTR